MNSPSPFFIVGCGRSGTSLLRSFLNAHSRIAIPTESLFIPDYLRVSNMFDLDYLLSLLIREPEIAEWGIHIREEDFCDASSIADVLRQLHLIYAESKGKDSWGQKTPRFVRSLDLIGNSFQDARFIHLIRDPRAVVNSLMRSDVHRSTAYHGARRWEMDVSAGLAYEKENPERVLRVRYENLVSKAEGELHKITQFLGFSYQSDMLVRKNGTDDYSGFYVNIHANLDKELSDQHIHKWRIELDEANIQTVEVQLHELMREVDYEPTGEYSIERGASPRRSKISRLFGLAAQLIKYIRQRPRYLCYLLYRKWKLGLLKEFLWSIHY
jgi:hypothetical protein